MTRLAIAGFAGSLSQPSKTRALVEHAATRVAAGHGGQAQVFDLLDLGLSLGAARRLDDLDAPARAIVDTIIAADALVIASPVFKGSYSGLFKHLFDLLDPTALAGKPVLLAATGGGEKHALVIEHQLRPLFAFFEAQVLATGLYASDRDFDNGRLTGVQALQRLDRAVAQFAPFLAPASQSHARVA